jgi:hypothetical protein
MSEPLACVKEKDLCEGFLSIILIPLAYEWRRYAAPKSAQNFWIYPRINMNKKYTTDALSVKLEQLIKIDIMSWQFCTYTVIYFGGTGHDANCGEWFEPWRDLCAARRWSWPSAVLSQWC